MKHPYLFPPPSTSQDETPTFTGHPPLFPSGFDRSRPRRPTPATGFVVQLSDTSCESGFAIRHPHALTRAHRSVPPATPATTSTATAMSAPSTCTGSATTRAIEPALARKGREGERKNKIELQPRPASMLTILHASIGLTRWRREAQHTHIPIETPVNARDTPHGYNHSQSRPFPMPRGRGRGRGSVCCGK